MINIINKTVGFLMNPLMMGILILCVALVVAGIRKRRLAMGMVAAAILWFGFWSMPIVGDWLCLPLEADYPVQLAEDMLEADAIVIMGGGVWGATNYPYASLKDGADRAWHAARLWKAGKAPIIIPSQVDAELCDLKMLVDLGVPRDAVVLENKAVNTEENAKFVREILRERFSRVEHVDHVDEVKPKVLLVTSACHMKRSLYMFEKYAPEIECVPAATDYQALPWKDCPFKWRHLLPDIGAFARNNSYIHEYIGFYGYKWFR